MFMYPPTLSKEFKPSPNNKMSIFHHEETPNPSAKRCKFTAAALKEAFSNCHPCGARHSTSSLEGSQESDSEDDQEDVVSEIRSRAMEKLRRKPGLVSDSFSWVFSAATGELCMTDEGLRQKGPDLDDHEKQENDEFLSVKSCFTRTSSASREAFFSVKTKFSRCSSLNGIDFKQVEGLEFEEFSRRLSILKELCQCEGWPFGLCRKALLLPPLPKSPSESWSWHRGKRPLK